MSKTVSLGLIRAQSVSGFSAIRTSRSTLNCCAMLQQVSPSCTVYSNGPLAVGVNVIVGVSVVVGVTVRVAVGVTGVGVAVDVAVGVGVANSAGLLGPVSHATTRMTPTATRMTASPPMRNGIICCLFL